MDDTEINLGLECPSCKEPWLRRTNLPDATAVSSAPVRASFRLSDCGSHMTIADDSDANVTW